MEVLDPGHDYLLDSLDGGEPIRLTFVKRCDPPEKYPGNHDAHTGVQLQDVLRASIERCQYLNNQFPCAQTEEVEANLARSLWLLEQRHVERHGDADAMNIHDVEGIERRDYCSDCGHIGCFCEARS